VWKGVLDGFPQISVFSSLPVIGHVSGFQPGRSPHHEPLHLASTNLVEALDNVESACCRRRRIPHHPVSDRPTVVSLIDAMGNLSVTPST